MTRQFLIPLSLVLAAIACASPEPASTSAPEIVDADVHTRSILVDTHNDILQRMVNEDVDIRARLSDGHSDLHRFAEGGVDAQFFSVWPDPIYGSDHSACRVLQQVDALYQLLGAAPDRIELATTTADVRRIVAEGKLAALMGIEGGHAIEDDLGVLRMFHRLGVRYMTLTHFNTNNWADSSTDVARFDGLSPFGEDVVREMNRIGMIVDISHVSDATFWDVMRLTTKPVIASHSSCRALCDHARNMSDEMIEAVGENGGVIGINFYPEYLDQEYMEKREAARGGSVVEAFSVPEERDPARLDELARERHLAFAGSESDIPPPTIDAVADHIDHVVGLVGADHVGLGSDFDGIDVAPTGLEDVTQYPDLTEILVERGYSDEDIEKILGENFLRVLRDVTGS